MTPERWQEVEKIYLQALTCPAEERSALLDTACAGDLELRREVESLLDAGRRGEKFLEVPAMEIAARAAAQNLPRLAPGRSLGPYKIISLLGAGGMGEVWRARDTTLDRDVAVKVLPPVYSRDPERLNRFEREARTAGQLNHPAIVAVHAIGDEQGVPYMVTEVLDGQTLGEHLRDGPLPPRKAVDYAIQIAQGLAAAHDKGIVHRDLKPDNIFVTLDGHVKILDFGLAKLTQPSLNGGVHTASGAVLGTAGYMSPEQVRGETTDCRSDIFSFGAVLYEMLSGRRAFDGDSAVETMNAILKSEPPDLTGSRSEVQPGLAVIVHRCLEKQPADRFQSARDLTFALQAISGFRAPGAASPVAPRRRIFRMLAVAVVAVAVALAAVFGIRGIWQGRNRYAPLPSKVPEANEYFRRAMLFVNTRQALPQARQMLEKALALDPRFAHARAWYGFTHVLLIDSGQSNDTSQLYRAQEELRRALQDDPKSARAHASLAMVYLYQGRKDLTPIEARTAIELDPNEREGFIQLALHHQWNGEYEQSQALLKPLLDFDPLFIPARIIMGENLRQMGDPAGSIREQEKTLEQDPKCIVALMLLAMAHQTGGDAARAREALARARALEPQNFQARLLWALQLAVEGNRTDAVKEMDSEVLKFGELIMVASNVAEAYAVLGDRDKSLDWLERAVRAGDERADWFQRDPLLAGVQKEPRFRQIIDGIRYRREQQAKSKD